MITAHAAVDTDLGVLKTGEEADVHLLERGVPDTGEQVLLAAERYRTAEHRMFHRDAGYTEGRRGRHSRETRAMASRTAFGRQLLAGQWARGPSSRRSARSGRRARPSPVPCSCTGRSCCSSSSGRRTARRHRGSRSSARSPTHCGVCGSS